MSLLICLAGATGWAGTALARAIVQAPELELVAGVSRRQAGRTIGEVLGISNQNAALFPSANQALAASCDVFVEYTHPDVAKANVSSAIRHGAHVVIGTSGLSDQDLADLDRLAREHRVGVLAGGHFSLATVVLTKCAQIAAKHLPQYEVLDYASAEKPDVPSGTARELAYKLAQVRPPQLSIPVEQTKGPRESRGATLNGVQVHSIRLPGHVISLEVLFGAGDEKLSLRYDAGPSPEPYVAGALLAIRRVNTIVGLQRGLDSILEL